MPDVDQEAIESLFGEDAARLMDGFMKGPDLTRNVTDEEFVGDGLPEVNDDGSQSM